MRNAFYLLLLGTLLLTAALITRSGILARKNPGRPINSAMREALNAEQPQLSGDDAMLIAKTFGTAHLRVRALGPPGRPRASGAAPPRAARGPAAG